MCGHIKRRPSAQHSQVNALMVCGVMIVSHLERHFAVCNGSHPKMLFHFSQILDCAGLQQVLRGVPGGRIYMEFKIFEPKFLHQKRICGYAKTSKVRSFTHKVNISAEKLQTRNCLLRVPLCVIPIYMKTLFLVRHAKSSWDNPGVRDINRPLNERGLHDAPKMGKLIRSLGIKPDLLVSSPAKRALTTAQFFCRSIRFAG
jgi:hypothetical protein